VKVGVWEAAERMMREYGLAAEDECEARASYHEMQGDPAVAEGWRRTKTLIRRLRCGERPPKV
jgi:hypothetical protein